MFRLSVLVFVSLIFAASAKPHKPQDEIKGQTFQDTLMSVDSSGKMLRGPDLKESVESPEDMDEIQEDIDPRMLVLQSKQEVEFTVNDVVMARKMLAEYLKPLTVEDSWQPVEEEEVRFERDVQRSARLHLLPEEDMDDQFHPDMQQVLQVQLKAPAEVEIMSPRRHTEPEEDLDHIYHRE